MSMKSIDEFTEEVLRRNALAALTARSEFIAARKIQSVVRGFLVRQRIKHMNKRAVLIQRIYRGHRDRKIYSKTIEDAAQKQTWDFYSNRALLIQKTFRGHWSRKTIFDFYHLKRWLKEIVSKGTELEEETWQFFFEERNRKLEESNAVARKLCIFIAKKLHHLLRTSQIPGVYSNVKSHALTQIEKLLASFSFRQFNCAQAKIKTTKKTKFLAKREELYKRTADAKSKFAGCEPHLRFRNLDASENNAGPQRTSTALKTGCIRHPYVKTMLASEKYCNNIMDMTREYEILTPDRNFCLNTRVVQNPQRIEQFIEVLHDFCVMHDLIEK